MTIGEKTTLIFQYFNGAFMQQLSALSEKEINCIEEARKRIAHVNKWGRWYAAFNCFLAVCTIGGGLALCIVVYYIVESLMGANQANPNPNQQQLDAVKIGLALGLVCGFSSGFFIYKGVALLHQTIVFFRGDITSQLLVKFHDGILGFMQNQNDGQLTLSDYSPEQSLKVSNDG